MDMSGLQALFNNGEETETEDYIMSRLHPIAPQVRHPQSSSQNLYPSYNPTTPPSSIGPGPSTTGVLTDPIARRTRSQTKANADKTPGPAPKTKNTSRSIREKQKGHRRRLHNMHVGVSNHTDSSSSGTETESDSDPEPQQSGRPSRQFPMRQVSNPNLDDRQPGTVEVYTPWKPQEMWMIMNNAPDKKTKPEDFIEHLMSTIRIYQATSRDLYSLCCMTLSAAEREKWQRFLGDNITSWVEFQTAQPQATNQIDLIRTALRKTLQQPLDLFRVLSCEPKGEEDGPEFFDRFCSTYATYAGDTDFNAGGVSPHFNALLMQCLPDDVCKSIKTHTLDWSTKSKHDMRNLVTHFWDQHPPPLPLS